MLIDIPPWCPRRGHPDAHDARDQTLQTRPPGEHEPKHPAVKFVVAAWNEGDFSDAEKHVATELAISINGLTYDPTR